MFGITINSNATGRIDIPTNGQLILQFGNIGWTSLETIRFVPADPRYTRVTMTTLENGWYQYGGDWGSASYVKTVDGRVVMQGLVGSGNWANGVRIYNIPDPLLPPLYLHIATRSNGFGYAGIEHRPAAPDGVVAKAVGNTYLALTLNYYPASYTNWTNLSLVNGWSTYGGVFSTPQYTKSSDGMVTLKGLIGGGSTAYDSVITTLPVGHRPAERILFTTVSAGAHVRLDILPSGQVRFMGGSSSWLSLDGVTFKADI